MSMRDATLELPSWLVPAALTAIVLGTIVAIIIPFVINEGWGGDAVHPALFCAILLFVALGTLMQTRFIVFPAQVKASREPEAVMEPAVLINSLSVLTFAFSVSAMIFAIVAAGFTGEVLYALPFPIVALITLGVLVAYINQQIEEFTRSARTARW